MQRVVDFTGIEHRDPAAGDEEQPAVGGPRRRLSVPDAEQHARHTVGDIELAHAHFVAAFGQRLVELCGIEPHDRGANAKPEGAEIVGHQRPDQLAGQSVLPGGRVESAALVADQPSARADPQDAAAILRDGVDDRAGALAPPVFGPEQAHGAVRRCEREPAVLEGHPETPLAIQVDEADRFARDVCRKGDRCELSVGPSTQMTLPVHQPQPAASIVDHRLDAVGARAPPAHGRGYHPRAATPRVRLRPRGPRPGPAQGRWRRSRRAAPHAQPRRQVSPRAESRPVAVPTQTPPSAAASTDRTRP